MKMSTTPTQRINMGHNGSRNPGAMLSTARMTKEGWRTARRLLAYTLTHNKWMLLAVAVCVVVTSLATLASTLFTRTLIDAYVLPLADFAHTHPDAAPDFTPLARTLCVLGAVLFVGAVCSYLQSRLMTVVSQGTLRAMRIDVFGHMQSLPIKFFDTHAHGDIMSVYTNDIDTLRQVVSTSLMNLFSSLVTILSTLISMIVLSVPLTLLNVVMIAVLVFATKALARRSAAYFKAQQENLGAVNGYVEEMLSGQKVIKTFCHEATAIAEFGRLNAALRDSAAGANKAANIVMPINGNIGHATYVLCAIVGALLVIGSPAAGTASLLSLSIGTLVSFLTLSKNFHQPVSQVSNQLNSIINAVAGAERVFRVLDEEPEQDFRAMVTLVNVRERADGTLEETAERTGLWAWKKPLPPEPAAGASFATGAGTLAASPSAGGSPAATGGYTLIRQRGEIALRQVDFA